MHMLIGTQLSEKWYPLLIHDIYKGTTDNDRFIQRQRGVSSQRSVGITDIIKYIKFGKKIELIKDNYSHDLDTAVKIWKKNRNLIKRKC